MARGNNHGGYRKPTNPAAVSVPGSGQRTDGGAGDRQPIRTPTGQPYGQAQALTQQQQVAPLPVAAQPVVAGGGGGGGTAAQQGAAVAPLPPSGIFGPTEFPNRPPTAGLTNVDIPPDPMSVLRVLYAKYPSPWLAELLDVG